MNNNVMMDKSYVLASIFKTKLLHFKEQFVTYKELNYVCDNLQKKYNEEDIPICIINGSDEVYFKYDDVILLNRATVRYGNYFVDALEKRFMGYIPKLDALIILWDDKYILELLINLKQEELDKARETLKNKYN